MAYTDPRCSDLQHSPGHQLHPSGTLSAVKVSDITMLPSRLIFGFLAIAGLLGQDTARPRFTKDKVLPYRSYTQRLLTRGQFVSIYGSDLTPRQWCGSPHAQQTPFPLELCGVQVLVGGF